MSRLTINLTLIVLFLNSFSSSGQTKKEIKETFFDGEASILYEEYQDAITSFDTLLSWFPENDNYKYRLGICYLNIPGQKQRSLGYLQQAVQNINPKYKDSKIKETASAYDAWYYLAKAYLVTNQIDKAITTYNRFLEGMDHRLYDSILVKKELEECYNAKRLMNIPLYLKSVNQGNIINTRFSDVNPVVSADENTIVYTNEAQFQDFIFYSKRVNGEWTNGIEILGQMLVDEGYSTSLSADGDELFLYRSDNYDGNIFSSTYVDGLWQPAVKLNDNINTKYWESHASISTDGSKLFFTSNKPGGYGGLDIYVSERDSLGDWGPAVNLGPSVNTPYNEETPFLDKTDNTLFFSSRGHFSMGGHDVFYTNQLDDGKWAVPINMGYPINSTDDDTFFHPVGQGYMAYVSKWDPEGSGMRDIHRVEIFSDDHPRKFHVRGMVRLRDLVAQFPDSVKISTLDKSNLDTLLIVYSDPETGEYDFEVPQGQYQIVYESDGSEKSVTDLGLDLTHPQDSVKVPEFDMVKSDLFAELDLVIADSISNYFTDDTSSITIKTEPNSLLVVEHWQGDSLIKREEFVIKESFFQYDVTPLIGDNNIKFTLTDRFNNTTVKDYGFTVEQPVVIIPDIIEITEVVAQDVSDSVRIKADPEIDTSIERLDNIISEVSKETENDRIADAVEKTKEKNIQNAGDWLESLYSVAMEDGAEIELLARLIAALSANLDESAEEYLGRLAKYASENLRRAIESFDMDKIDGDNPDEIIQYLLEHAEEYGYTQSEVFKAFAELINSDKKSAEEIVNYIERSEGNNLWNLWLFIGAGALIFFFLWRKKKKREEK